MDNYNHDHLIDILGMIQKHYHLNDDKAVLFLSGEDDIQVVASDARGSMKVLARAFANQMEKRPEFNQLMKALLGSYLAQNPKEKEEFIKGLGLVSNLPNMN